MVKKRQHSNKHKKKNISRKHHKKIRRKKSSNKKFSEKDELERVASGIPNFDRLIESGFKKDSTNVVVGGSGSGKTIFATQFLIDGLLKGEKCLFVTFEEKKLQFYNNMLKFGWDLSEYEKKGKFIFLEYSPSKVKTMLEEGGGTIESIIVGKKVSRMVIDSITSFALLFKDELSKREAALSLFSQIKRWSCTSLLTLEQEPSSTKEATSKSLEFESDSIILLYFIREKKIRQRYLEILKMRGTDHSKEIYKFNISKKGIIIEKRPSSIKALC